MGKPSFEWGLTPNPPVDPPGNPNTPTVPVPDEAVEADKGLKKAMEATEGIITVEVIGPMPPGAFDLDG